MKEILENFGLTDQWITIIEFAFYIILIVAGLFTLVKQIKKVICKLVPKIVSIKSLKRKLKALKVFRKWFIKAIKDGCITDDEVIQINNEFSAIVNSANSQSDMEFNQICNKAISNISKVQVGVEDED